MNAIKATLMILALASTSALVDVAMTGPVTYLLVMAAGLAAIAVIAVRPAWKP